MTAALGALLVVGGLAAALAVLRRRAAAGPAPALAVEARIALGKETGVALVRHGGRALLVGYGPGGVRALVPGAGHEERP